MEWKGVLHRYFEHLPLEERKNIVSLNEGNSPLIRTRKVEDK